MGKKGCKNMPMNAEELGILKGNILTNLYYVLIHFLSLTGYLQELYPGERISSEHFNSILNNICCGARRRQKTPQCEEN